METILLATLVPVAWASVWLALARTWYQQVRPSKVPLCNIVHEIDHKRSCYTQEGGFEIDGEAMAFALVTGALWPVVLPLWAIVSGVGAAVRGKLPELPAEREARLKKDIREVEDA